MTAVGGCVGPCAAESACRAILTEQSAYGSDQHSIEQRDFVAFGASSNRPVQTVATEGDRWLAVADVRLDNRAELARMIGLPDDPSWSDTQILLKAWDKRGEDTLQHILGDFALAIFDRSRRELILARDPTGQQPLFFRTNGRDVAFASMPSGIRETFCPSALNARMLASHLAYAQHAGLATPFEHVERVLPGEIVRFRNGDVSRSIYWQPATYPTAALERTGMVEAYRDLLDRAVGDRIAGKTKLGSHLSSGFDSNAVTATAARLAGPGAELTCFTSAPLEQSEPSLVRNWFADESPLAARAALAYSRPHVVVRETQPLFDVIRRQTGLVQAPLWAPFNMCWWAEIRRRASEIGIQAILTGESGNFTISAGGLATLAYYVRAGQWGDWWREAKAAKEVGGARWRGIAANSFGSRLPAFLWNRARRVLRGIPARTSFLRPHWQEAIGADNAAFKPSGDPYADRLGGLRLGDMGAYRKAAIGDRGIPEIDPTADRRLIEFSLALPPDQLLRNGVSRPLARAALADRVPSEVLEATARGMQGTDWHLRIDQRSAREALEDIASIPLVRELLDISRMEVAIDAWPQRDFNSLRTMAIYRNALTGALATGIFIKSFGD